MYLHINPLFNVKIVVKPCIQYCLYEAIYICNSCRSANFKELLLKGILFACVGLFMNEEKFKLCKPRGWISKSANNSVVYILLLFEKPVKHHDILNPLGMLRDALTLFSLG
jgi:hypothetical protein